MTWKIWDQDVQFSYLSSSTGKYLIAEIIRQDEKGIFSKRTQVDATITRINHYEGVVINAPKIGGEIALSPLQRRSSEGIPLETSNQKFHDLCEKCHDLAVKYYKRGRSNSGYDKAFKICSESAERGHAKSQFLLAMFYIKGIGTIIDYIQAHIWFKRAARQDHAKAQYNLANMYITGKGTQRDDSEAFYWYARAAQNGIEDARTILKSRRSANELFDDMMNFHSSDKDITEKWEFYVPSYSYDEDYDGKMIKLSGRMLHNPRTRTFTKLKN